MTAATPLPKAVDSGNKAISRTSMRRWSSRARRDLADAMTLVEMGRLEDAQQVVRDAMGAVAELDENLEALIAATKDRFITFADGYGRWHAGVRRDHGGDALNGGGGVIVARGLIRDELKARGAVGDRFPVRVERAPVYDTETHLFWRETSGGAS